MGSLYFGDNLFVLRDEIKDESIKNDLESSRPKDQEAVRVWAEDLLREWLGEQSIDLAEQYLAKGPTKENRRGAIEILRENILERFPKTRAAERAKVMLKDLGEE